MDEPWCGSDGRTYPSLCHLRATTCMERTAVVPLYEGECLTTMEGDTYAEEKEEHEEEEEDRKSEE